MTMVSVNLLLWTAEMKSHVQKRTSPIVKPVIRARSQRPPVNPTAGSVWTNRWSTEPHVAIPLAAQGQAPANRVSASATMTTHVQRMPSLYAIQETPVKSLHPPVNPMVGSVWTNRWSMEPHASIQSAREIAAYASRAHAPVTILVRA